MHGWVRVLRYLEESMTKEIAVVEHCECSNCGETLVRVLQDDGRLEDFKEVASGQEHECWSELPFEAEHLRID